MLEEYGNEIMCFAINKKYKRIPLNISELINIRKELLNSINAIQLYK